MTTDTPTFDTWPGNTILTGGKGYASTPMGQVHYRDIGPRSDHPVVLLLHQSQMSILQYAEIQPALAALGYRSIAVDTPGHGMSDAPPYQPTLEQLADNLVRVLGALGLDQVVVAGHHSGSAIAMSLAAHHPDRVAAVILHGAVAFNAQERADRLASPQWDRTPKADGSHVGAWFRPFQGDQPGDPATLKSRTWMLLSLFMMGPDIGKPAVYGYDMISDAPLVKAPTLLLTDLADSVHPFDDRMADLRPDFTYQVFSDTGPMTMTNEPDRWAQVIADYLGKVLGGPLSEQS